MLGVYRKVSTSEDFNNSEGALPFSLQHVAEIELGETPSRRKDAVQKFMQVVSDEPELNSTKDDDFLLRFLRVRKYNFDAALQSIRNYYKIRTACGPVYCDFLPSKVPSAARKLFTVMPKKDVHGRPILSINIGQWIPSELPFLELHKTFTVCLEHMASDPVTQVLGAVILLDYKGFTRDNMPSVGVGHLKKAVEYLQYQDIEDMEKVIFLRANHAHRTRLLFPSIRLLHVHLQHL